jgi:hypothetical protein
VLAKLRWFLRVSLLFVFGGLLFVRPTDSKARSIPRRIAAVQKAVERLPAEVREPFILRAQWGNWGNWNNWNNWANWANFNNWNNWGNWMNY